MALRFSQVKTEYQLLVSVTNCVWGSNRNKFSKWKVGEWLVILVKKELAVLAKVTGPSFYSDDILWKNYLYTHRIPIEICRYYEPESRLNYASIFQNLFKDNDIKIGFQIITQNPFPKYIEKEILKKIMAVPGSPLKKETLIRELNKERNKNFGKFGKILKK